MPRFDERRTCPMCGLKGVYVTLAEQLERAPLSPTSLDHKIITKRWLELKCDCGWRGKDLTYDEKAREAFYAVTPAVKMPGNFANALWNQTSTSKGSEK